MLTMPQNTDGRRTDRARTFIAARILFNKGSMQVECTVRNLSDGGAKLEVSEAVTLPDEFDLLIPQRAVTRRARLCWRSASFCGVAFLDAVEPHQHQHSQQGPTVGEQNLRGRIQDLEQTIASLQRRIRELTGG
ncbi:MAG: PilZ domain-containing protein [Microvirga sp.]|nr:PilZ domain-containing protein [Microvirga sp.]